ncbi:hypothetical protein SteCoe_19836 [Stentor coeruleus]|uniref:Kinesin-like protein n=1 Tax=Stentor coeruleus TaxID=5963 RepID=A0A1R2BT70_9CILI|nr:hypothetical protein SteCoe_19836 [Stentor coeruleus]
MSASEEINENLTILARLQQEFEEFQLSCRESEIDLEKELADKEIKLEELLLKSRETDQAIETIKEKYFKNECEISRLQNEQEAMKKKIKNYEKQMQELEQLNNQWENSAKVLEYSKLTLEERLYQAEENAILYKEELDEISQNKIVEIQRLKDHFKELKEELYSIEISSPSDDRHRHHSPTPSLKHTIEHSITIPAGAFTRSKNPSRNTSRNVSRKASFDENSSKESVKVLVIFRPPTQSEIWDEQVLSIEANSIQFKEKNKEPKSFDFEKVFIPGTSTENIFKEIEDSIQRLAIGGNACVMAYGQTGSGKTYTMNAMISLSLNKLEEILTEDYDVSLQCIEIYNEQIKDLLTDEGYSKNLKDTLAKAEVKLSEDWRTTSWDLVQKAISRRTTKFTECNEKSSRSHAIVWFTISGPAGIGKVQFVDLAGSERIGKSQVVGDTLKEALLINKSLSALQDVISALENRQKHIPYRNSMLTQVLQSTLGGSESIVNMIMNCSPSMDSLNETLCTLALGSRVKAVDLGFIIRKNIVTKEIERTLTLLEKERSDKNSMLRTLDKLQRDLESSQIALKDKDNKIAILKSRMNQKEKDYLNKKMDTHIIISSHKKKNRHEESEIRVSSLSPTNLISPTSYGNSRIPTMVNLKLSKKDN